MASAVVFTERQIETLTSFADGKANPDTDAILTVREVATLLQLRPETIRRKIAAGDIEAFRIADGEKASLRIRGSALGRWMDKRKVSGEGGCHDGQLD